MEPAAADNWGAESPVLQRRQANLLHHYARAEACGRLRPLCRIHCYISIDEQRCLTGIVDLVSLAIDDTRAVAVGATGGSRSPACPLAHPIASLPRTRSSLVSPRG
jgi:hypothetical protein